MKQSLLYIASLAVLLSACTPSHQNTDGAHKAVGDHVIASQRQNLALNTKDKGYGPQSNEFM